MRLTVNYTTVQTSNADHADWVTWAPDDSSSTMENVPLAPSKVTVVLSKTSPTDLAAIADTTLRDMVQVMEADEVVNVSLVRLQASYPYAAVLGAINYFTIDTEAVRLDVEWYASDPHPEWAGHVETYMDWLAARILSGHPVTIQVADRPADDDGHGYDYGPSGETQIYYVYSALTALGIEVTNGDGAIVADTLTVSVGPNVGGTVTTSYEFSLRAVTSVFWRPLRACVETS